MRGVGADGGGGLGAVGVARGGGRVVRVACPVAAGDGERGDAVLDEQDRVVGLLVMVGVGEVHVVDADPAGREHVA